MTRDAGAAERGARPQTDLPVEPCTPAGMKVCTPASPVCSVSLEASPRPASSLPFPLPPLPTCLQMPSPPASSSWALHSLSAPCSAVNHYSSRTFHSLSSETKGGGAFLGRGRGFPVEPEKQGCLPRPKMGCRWQELTLGPENNRAKAGGPVCGLKPPEPQLGPQNLLSWEPVHCQPSGERG